MYAQRVTRCFDAGSRLTGSSNGYLPTSPTLSRIISSLSSKRLYNSSPVQSPISSPKRKCQLQEELFTRCHAVAIFRGSSYRLIGLKKGRGRFYLPRNHGSTHHRGFKMPYKAANDRGLFTVGWGNSRRGYRLAALERRSRLSG